MFFVTVHVVADQLQIEACPGDLFQPQVEGVVIRVALISLIHRVGFGFIGGRKGVDPGVEAGEAQIHVIEAAAGAIVLNVLPVKLMAGSVGAAVALTGPEGHLRRKIQIAQLGEPFTKLHIMAIVILTVPVGGAFRLVSEVGLHFRHHAAVRRQRYGGDQFDLGVFFVAQSPLAVRHQADGVRAVAIRIGKDPGANIAMQRKIILRIGAGQAAGPGQREESQRY